MAFDEFLMARLNWFLAMLCFIEVGWADLKCNTMPEFVGLIYSSVSILVPLLRSSTVTMVSRKGTPLSTPE